MTTVIADHSNGCRFLLEDPQEDPSNIRVVGELPKFLVEKNMLQLENKRTIYLNKCDFFDGVLGVGATWAAANDFLNEHLAKMWTRMGGEKVFFDYLKDKGFKFKSVITPLLDAQVTATARIVR